MYEQTESGIKGLDLKVLDMGMGQERNAWFSQGCSTIYDATFPTVIKHLIKATGFTFDDKLIGRYVPYGGLLNLDEVDDINKAWQIVSEKVGSDVNTLKNNILPLAGIYSLAEHSRSLLIMFSDGALPSNVGDSYNLRIILRRMLGFIDKYSWSVDVHKLFELHAKYLKPQYPELLKNLDDVKKIFNIEKEKYQKTKEKSIQIVSKIASSNIDVSDLVKLYDSQGIQPELIVREAKKLGSQLIVGVVRDAAVKKKKGNDRPIQNESTRLQIIEALSFVDKAVYQDEFDPTPMLEQFKPYILAKGDDWDYIPGQEWIKSNGGKLVKIPYTKGHSTSSIVEKLKTT